jgi:hypothetical protein
MYAFPILFASSGWSLAPLYSVFLFAVTVVIAYVSLRLAIDTEMLWQCPTLCGFMLLMHPCWTISTIHGDGGDAQCNASFVFCLVACCCVVVQYSFRQRMRHQQRALNEAAMAWEMRHGLEFFPGDPATPSAEMASHGLKRTDVPLPGLTNRILAATLLALFAYFQWRWFIRGPNLGRFEPEWILGPLYFLHNPSRAQDWIGYALLTVAVPCLLSVVIWPNRWTALVASLTAWGWVLPGTVECFYLPKVPW